MVEPIFDYQFRLILIGDSTVGKSSLLKYFTDGKFFEVGGGGVCDGGLFLGRWLQVERNFEACVWRLLPVEWVCLYPVCLLCTYVCAGMWLYTVMRQAEVSEGHESRPEQQVVRSPLSKVKVITYVCQICIWRFINWTTCVCYLLLLHTCGIMDVKSY